MADNYLITGYWGEPHVTAENDRGIQAGIFGVGRYVLPVGKQFRAENIGNNTIRIYDGKLVDNGAAAGIPAGEYVDLVVSNASQGMNRNDLIVFQYTQDSSTMIESGTFVVVQGVESSGEAVDPDLQQEDLLSGRATIDQMALWRIPISTGAISAPVQLFEVSKSLDKVVGGGFVADAISGDGSAYTATVEDLEELYNGLEITIIPNITSKTTAPTLNVNGFGAKPIRLALSENNTTLVQPDDAAYYAAGRPIKLMYDTNYLTTGAWKVSNKQRPSASNLYGVTPVSKGGTGLESVPVGSFLVGNGTEAMNEITPEELVELLGCASFVKLWENASGGSSFGSQTISVDLTDYSVILIECSYIGGRFLTKGMSAEFSYASLSSSSSTIYAAKRTISTSNSGVTVGGCKAIRVGAETAETSEDDKQIVPVAIWGIKGVQ